MSKYTLDFLSPDGDVLFSRILPSPTFQVVQLNRILASTKNAHLVVSHLELGEEVLFPDNGLFFRPGNPIPFGNYRVFTELKAVPITGTSNQQQIPTINSSVSESPLSVSLVSTAEICRICINALMVSSEATGEPNILLKSSQSCINYLENQTGLPSQIIGAAVSRSIAPLPYLVVVTDQSIIVTINVLIGQRDRAISRLEALLASGPPAPLDQDGKVNAAALALAGALPYASLFKLCSASDGDIRRSTTRSSQPQLPTSSSSHVVLPPSQSGSRSAALEPSNVTERKLRDLIFSGHGISGPIAHIAAILARKYFSTVAHECPGDAPELKISAVTFSSPPWATSELATNLIQESASHYTFENPTDILSQLARRAMELNVVDALLRQKNQFTVSCSALVASLLTHCHLDAKKSLPPGFAIKNVIIEAVQSSNNLLPPADTPYFLNELLQQSSTRVLVEMSANSEVGFVPFGQFLTSRNGVIQSVLSVSPETFSRVAYDQVFRFHNQQIAQSLLGRNQKPNDQNNILPIATLVPVLSDCTAHVNERSSLVRFTFQGTGFDSLLQRLPSDGPPICLALILAPQEFRFVQGEFIQVTRIAEAEACVNAIGLELVPNSLQRTVSIRTDFGDSNSISVNTQTHDQFSNPALATYGRMSKNLLITAFLRGCLVSAAVSEDGLPDHILLDIISQLESILLSSNEFPQILSRSGSAESLLYGQAEVSPIFFSLVEKMTSSIALETATQSLMGKPLRAFLKILGKTASTVLGVISGILLLPAMLIGLGTLPVVLRNTDTDFQNLNAVEMGALLLFGVPAVILAIPGGLVAAVCGLIYQAADEITDPQSLQYLQVLKTILTMVGGNPALILNEIPHLEDAICHTMDEKLPEKPLFAATTIDILPILKVIAPTEGPRFGELTRSLQDRLSRIICAVGRFALLRKLLLRHVAVAFVGVHNAGKSSWIRELFGIETNPDDVVRTERVGLYHLTESNKQEVQTSTSKVEHLKSVWNNLPGLNELMEHIPLTVDVLDFPGTTDEREGIARMTSRYASVASFFVVVLKIKHIAAPEKKIIDEIKMHNIPFMVLISQRDLYESEPDFDPKRLRDHYASVLDINPHLIIICSVKRLKSIEFVRRNLFGALSTSVEPEHHGCLSVSLLHPSVRNDLYSQSDLCANWGRAERTIGNLMATGQPITIGTVRSGLTMSDNLLTFIPVLVNPSALQHPQASSDSKDRCMSPTSNFDGIYGDVATLLCEMGYSAKFSSLLLNLIYNTLHSPALSLPMSGTSESSHSELSHLADLIVPNISYPELVSLTLDIAPIAKTIIKTTLALYSDREQAIYRLLKKCNLYDISSLRTSSDLVGLLDSKLDSLSPTASSIAPDVHSESWSSAPRAPSSSTFEELEQTLEYLSSFSLGLSSVSACYRYCDLSPVDTSFGSRLNMFITVRDQYIQERWGSKSPTVCQVMTPGASESFSDQIFNIFSQRSVDELVSLRINLTDDPALDLGGVMVSLFTTVNQELLQNKHPSFAKPLSSSDCIYFSSYGYLDLNRAGDAFRALGRMVGFILLKIGSEEYKMASDVHLDCIPGPMCKLILGEALSILDLQILDPVKTKSIYHICGIDSEEELLALDLEFSATTEHGTFQLSPHHDPSDLVNSSSRLEYLLLFCWFYLARHLPLSHFVQGVLEFIPRDLLMIFSPQMLQLLINGEANISVEWLQSEALVVPSARQPLDSIQRVITDFWSFVQSLDMNDLTLLLIFITGSSRRPIQTGEMAHSIMIRVINSLSSDSLPIAHVCFRMIDLPFYANYEILCEKLLTAIRNTQINDFGYR